MFSILTQIMLKLSFYTQLYTYLKLGQLKKIVAKKVLLEQFLICAYDHSPIKRSMSTGCAKLIQFRTQTSVSCVESATIPCMYKSVSCVESATILACKRVSCVWRVPPSLQVKRVSRVWRVPPSLHAKECLVCGVPPSLHVRVSRVWRVHSR